MNKFSLDRHIDKDFQMNKGFCILAENNYKTDYVKQAYALVLSIHKHNKENISIITDDIVPDV